MYNNVNFLFKNPKTVKTNVKLTCALNLNFEVVLFNKEPNKFKIDCACIKQHEISKKSSNRPRNRMEFVAHVALVEMFTQFLLNVGLY